MLPDCKYYLAAGGVVRESRFVREWLVFHHLAGVEFFVLYTDDNGIKKQLRDLPFRVVVHKLSQAKRLFKRYGDVAEWFAVLNENEYLFAPDGTDLKSVLKGMDHGGGVLVPRIVYGHAGHAMRPEGLTVDRYVLRKPMPSRATVNHVSIVRNGGKNGSEMIVDPLSHNLRVNHYAYRSMEDWVERHQPGESEHGVEEFGAGDCKIVDRAACLYSKLLRQMFGMPIHDADLENTVFVSTCDYPFPEDMSEYLLKTAKKFGVPIRWASWGERWNGYVETKIGKMLRFLESEKSKGMKYAFMFDSRDVVFTAPVEKIFHDFNLIYEGGVLFNADKKSTFWPLERGILPKQVIMNYGRESVANGGVCCGLIDEIIGLYRSLLAIRDDLVTNKYSLRETKMLSVDPEFCKYRSFCDAPLLEDDQFLLHVSQMNPESVVRVDFRKELMAAFDDVYPDLSKPCEHPYDEFRSTGTASILHTPWLSVRRCGRPNYSTYVEWVENMILKR